MTTSAVPTRVWRIGRAGRVLGSMMAAWLALAALSRWIVALVRWSGTVALGATGLTAGAALFSLLAWWVFLRPELAVTDEEVIAVNPWGSRRVARAEVVGVTPGTNGARLRLRGGDSVLVWVLAGSFNPGSHPRQLATEVTAAIHPAPR